MTLSSFSMVTLILSLCMSPSRGDSLHKTSLLMRYKSFAEVFANTRIAGINVCATDTTSAKNLVDIQNVLQ